MSRVTGAMWPPGFDQVFRAVRVLAWVALAGATGWLVRADVRRPVPRDAGERRTNVVYRVVGTRRARLDVYLPEARGARGGRPAIVAIHGGGWRGGSKRDWNLDELGRMAPQLARHGYVVFAVDYLLARPGAPSWPDCLDDVRAAVRWVRLHAAEYDVDPHKVAAVGASAGGHLAALLGTCSDPADPARVQAVVDLYGPSDLRALWEANQPAGGPAALLLGGSPRDVPDRYEEASPLRHVSSADPPMLLIHGADDARVPLAQSETLAAALQGAGVPHRLIVVAGARHGFGFQVAGRDLLPDVLAFLENAWNVNR
jgi:acetyl esterase/lipase